MISDAWTRPAMIAGGVGGHGFLGGWGGGGCVSSPAGPVGPMVLGSGYGVGPVVPITSRGHGGLCCDGHTGCYHSSGKRKNRRVRHESHHYCESTPTGCRVM